MTPTEPTPTPPTKPPTSFRVLVIERQWPFESFNPVKLRCQVRRWWGWRTVVKVDNKQAALEWLQGHRTNEGHT